MNHQKNNSPRPTEWVGKYQISPLTQRLADGGFRASVSVRSGRGSATTDRVMRLIGRFDSERLAQRAARAQGLLWVAQSGGGVPSCTAG